MASDQLCGRSPITSGGQPTDDGADEWPGPVSVRCCRRACRRPRGAKRHLGTGSAAEGADDGCAEMSSRLLSSAPRKGATMARFVTFFSYTPEAWARLLDNPGDFLENFEPQRQPGIRSGGLLLDHSGAQHELVRDDLGFLRRLLENRQEIPAETHRNSRGNRPTRGAMAP